MNKNFFVIKQTDSFKKEIITSGIMVDYAYVSRRRCINVMRRLWNKANLPFKKIWYNKRLINLPYNIILVYEPLITVDFVKWLRKNNPDTRIIFIYLNIVKTSVNPNELKKYCEVYSWDKGDCEKYQLQYYGGAYFKLNIDMPLEKEYDAIFIGRDKGRMEYLNELEKTLNNSGLKAMFYIVGDNNRRNSYNYKPELSYEQLLNLTLKSKAIIDVVQEGQSGTTYRTMESLFYKIKLITNNHSLVKYDFYNPQNVFILGKDDLSTIKKFITLPYVEQQDDIINKYTFDGFIESF